MNKSSSFGVPAWTERSLLFPVCMVLLLVTACSEPSGPGLVNTQPDTAPRPTPDVPVVPPDISPDTGPVDCTQNNGYSVRIGMLKVDGPVTGLASNP